MLNGYGRELSRELQSTWGQERESSFAYGVVKLPEWIDAGGNMRYLQIVQDTPTAISGRGFWMQADLEAAVRVGEKLTLVGTVGWKGNADSLKADSAILSRRHFAMYAMNDRLSVRAGRFYPFYGLMQAEHKDPTRSNLGFDQGEESYNLEFSDQNENGSFFVTPIFGKFRGERRPDERGLAVSKFFVVNGNSRVGFSALYGKGSRASYDSRIAFGPSAVLNFSNEFFWMGEVDLDRRKIPGNGSPVTGLYQLQKLSYEPVKGVIFSARQDLQRRQVGDSRSGFWTAGPMIDWYPRPHFDLQLTASRAFLPGGADGLWIYTGVLHFYL